MIRKCLLIYTFVLFIVNIFEEELPQLYDSFIADPSSPKPMTLSYFLNATGFHSKPMAARKPKQVLHSNHGKNLLDIGAGQIH